MFILRMWSWVSLTMTLILCLTLTLIDVTEANYDAILIGTVYCDTCFQQHFSTFSHFISGALVAVECGGDEIQASAKKPRFRVEVKTNVKGEFRVTLPFSATKHVDEIKQCSVKLLSSSEPNCAVAVISTATSSSIRVKMKTHENHVFSTGFFTFQPLEQPKRCQWESHANSNDEIIASTPLPSPVVDGMLAPILPLTDQNHIRIELHDLAEQNNFRSSYPRNQIMSPSLIPSFPSHPPPGSMFIPEVPSSPDSMLNMGFQPPPDSMLNTGFQAPPDSMLNMGFQPPPDSMLNTGFRPPPDSTFNTDFQPPPPDSMFNAGFRPPPLDLVFNRGFQPPPDSMFNTGFNPPPPPESMFNTGFQPPPQDSMFNRGFQPPPQDSMFNTGFQPPPPDSLFNTGFQSPPPDSMFNPNPLQAPPDSTFIPSQPLPPSLTPQRLTPPPPPPLSLPSPPLDSQPDLIQATPPPPINPTFPAFPFQPSAGLPRMPPGTGKPPLLYKDDMGNSAKLIVDALLQRFIPLARRRIEMTQLRDGHYSRPSDPAYEQVLDSLALVARHMPVSLLEELLRWRDIESPKGANDTSTFLKKLMVECIFCSASIRFVQCCPPEGLAEKLWSGLEHFVFDWLINADRVVSQAEYPSLVELRGLLLDLVSHLVGALSLIRFIPVTGRFIMELNARRIDTSGARIETLSIINGMRHLRLGVKTDGGLNMSASFVAKANPLNHAPTKRKGELHHALCKMLSNILAPLTDGNKCHWPPSGVQRALTVWYEAVARVRMQILHWADKQSKHIPAAYPLVTLLLCLGDPLVFLSNFGPHTEQLYKQLKDKNNRFMALDCLHHVTRFYLGVHGRSQPSNRVWDYLDSVTSQLLTILRKGMLTHDVQHDKLVQLCVTIGEHNLDFCINHLILEMLKQDSPSEAKIIGLRALLDISMSPTSGRVGLEILQAQDLGHYIPKVKIAIESILRSCHRTYNLALLTSSKTTIDAITKEKSHGYLFRSVLKCVPYLIKDVGRSDRITEIIPQHGISVDHGVREEAIQVLNRIVRCHPDRRFAVVRGMMNFILRLPDEFPLLIQTTLGHLLDLLRLWRSCLLDENIEHDASRAKHVQINLRSKRTSFNHGEPIEFHASEIDAIGLIFLTSADGQIRHTALELLRCVRDIRNDIQNCLLCDKLDLIKDEAEPILMVDVFEENGDDIVQNCYWDSNREFDVAPPDATLEVMLFENHDKNRWARCLSELVKYGALLCPHSVQEAKVQITKRLALVTPVELGGKAHQVQDADNKLDQWLMYAVFACSCPPGREGSGAAATRELFHLIIPSLKSGSEASVHAAIMALGRSHLDVCEIMFSELASFMDEISSETEGKSKWKIQKPRREELRIHISNIYRTVADNIWPGMLACKPVLRLHYLKHIDETTKLISTPFENFQDLQTLRYSLACILRTLAPEFVDSKSEKFDLKTRKRLFDLFLSCCDDSGNTFSQDGLSDYRREVERYKSSQHARSKDSIDKLKFDKELSEQVEAVQWASMNCMASLLYGPCFDFDNARKMSGRIIYWINSLFIESAPRAPFGYSPTDPKGPFYAKHKSRVGNLRVSLAKIALKNLILSNLDLFPACIDQCYYSDADVADGYFSVLAEVYMRQDIQKCEIQRLLSLILYKVVDPSRQVRDDALQMLETLSAREWAEDKIEGTGSYQVAVVGNLPDSYQQFQYKLSCKLAKDRPELSQLLCEEIMQRQLDAVDIIAQHQVLTCMAPWIENLDFWKLQNSGWKERLLKSLYYVTWRHADQFPDEIEKLWRTIASKPRNIRPVLDFLITKGIEDCDSNASTEISGAFATYFSVAKRVSLYLARICPQGTVDHLVYQLAQRMLEESLESTGVQKSDFNGNFVLEFSLGPAIAQLASVMDNQPLMSPFLVRGSVDSLLRNTSGRTTLGSRATSGPVISVPPEITVACPSHRRLRGSAGNSRSRHVSRDSGDYLTDTPNSESDSHGVSARELNTALQGHQHQQHLLTHADIALILLAEIAYENDEDFREHLPLLFHVTFVSMDSSEDIVLEHCQRLLVNLLYSLGGRHLELYNVENNDGENRQLVVSLIKYVQSKRGTMMWENEDPTVTGVELQSAKLLSALVQSMVDAIFFQGDLRETWGAEALKWAMECTSRHLSCRSHQIYRALRPRVNHDACISLLRCLHRCLANPIPEVLGFIMEILLTLQVMVENVEPEKVILYPHLFWGCVAMMHTDYVHVYCQVLELFARVIDLLTFSDRTTENVLLSSMPRDELDHGAVDSEDDVSSPSGADGTVPVFEGVQPLVLKGLMSTVSHDISIEVLSRLTVPSCDSIFGDPQIRLLMHITGLLPWLCLHLNPDAVVGLGSGSTPALLQQHQKARSVSMNLAIWCEAKSLDELATIFMAYSQGKLKTIDNLLACVSPLLCSKWAPTQSVLAFGHLLNILEKGPVEYQRVVLIILKQLVHHIPMDAVQNQHMYALISQLVESSLCSEALGVLEALLHNYEPMTASINHDQAHYESSLGGVDESAFMVHAGPSTESCVSAKELALRNTRIILGRVLDNCVLGRRRDYKRLVPFMNTIGVELIFLLLKMDMRYNYEPSSAVVSVYACRPESEFDKTTSRTFSVADTFQELESVGEVVTRVELDMICVCTNDDSGATCINALPKLKDKMKLQTKDA
ncbi:hypothetical protein L1987_36671 [Smallanthus sonchifolius]|uniref:Uncharacterized protein n=1 Tax=Smallanthus sonchifolius TaxID=185202 RepID=A0ACB9HEW3_9ASTR|nr:hypothetical protein L1987_36671 [Smallanthus sonchifolius]